MTDKITSSIIRTTVPVATKTAEYGKEIKQATDSVPKKEMSTALKLFSGPILSTVYENQAKINAAGKKVAGDIKENAKENAKVFVESYENKPLLEKAMGGLLGKACYEFNKWLAE